MTADHVPGRNPVPDPTTLAAAIEPIRERIRERGIDVDTPIDWDEIDRKAHADWQAERIVIRQNAWRSQVPPEFADADLDRLDSVEQAGALRVWLGTPTRNVLMTGPVGVGKTYAAYALGNAALTAGLAPFAVTAADLLAMLRPNGDPKMEAWALGADILIVDDLGAEKDTEWTAEAWHRITDHRYRNQMPIVVTTNETYDALTTKYGNRIVSRLMANHALVMKFDGPDRRAAAFGAGPNQGA